MAPRTFKRRRPLVNSSWRPQPPGGPKGHLRTRFGVAAVEAVAAGQVGTMVALTGSAVAPVPLSVGVGPFRTVPVAGELVLAGRALGICLGDEAALLSADG